MHCDRPDKSTFMVGTTFPNADKSLLAISGSLRSTSSNKTLLQAAAALAPDNVTITLSDSIANLPHFNPDADTENPPPAVVDFRNHLQQADGVLICTPEYAHGIPGALKNALDWIVGSGELMNKPVALINPSQTSFHAQESLVETLTVMMAKVHAVRLPLNSTKITVDDILANADLSSALSEIIFQLLKMDQGEQQP
jgi:NAD(P)H-dependent FMN reductase